MIKKTAILIIAAGASKRMGVPKQLLPWNQSNLLIDTINKVATIKGAAVFVVLGAHYNEIAKSLEKCSVNIIKNNHWEEGMGSSIAVGIRAIMSSTENYKEVLITLTDLPLVTASHYTNLNEAFNTGKKSIVITQYKNTKGVPVVFDTSHFKSLSLLKGDDGAKTIIANHQSEIMVVNCHQSFVDIDTLEAYENLLKIKKD